LLGFQNETFYRDTYWAGTAADAVVQEAGGFPNATLGSSLEVEEKGTGGMTGFKIFEAAGGGVDDDGEFVVEIVCGGGGNGTSSVGVRESFHNRMVAGEWAEFWACGGKGLWNE
jgi:hypothetical protein